MQTFFWGGARTGEASLLPNDAITRLNLTVGISSAKVNWTGYKGGGNLRAGCREIENWLRIKDAL